jgi:hypothetical protein
MSVIRRRAGAVFIAAGLVWAFRSLQSFTDPQFTDPQSLNDWAAVLALSLAMWLLVPALLVLPQPSVARWAARFAAAAAAVVGLANLAEDGFDVESAGVGFALGNAVLLLSCVAMSVLCLAKSPRWAAVVPAATVIGLLQLENAGGLVILLGWWFAAWQVTARSAAAVEVRSAD